MSFSFAPPTPRRRPSLTPMIDVVFLLLVFFMLAARFGQEAEITLNTAIGGGGTWTGPPRLVDVAEETLRLNGSLVEMDRLSQILRDMVDTSSDPVLLRPSPGADTQRLIDVLATLRGDGFSNLIVIAP